MSRAKTLLQYASFLVSVGSARVAGVLITSLTFPYLVRRLGVETYGLWSYVVAVCAFLEIISNPGLMSFASQQVGARRHAALELIPDVLILRVFGSLAAILVLLVIASFEVRIEVRQLFLWYGVGLFVVNLTTVNFLLNALEMFHAASLLGVAQQALYAIGIFGFVHSPRDILHIPISILFSVFLTNLGGWIFLWHRGVWLRWTVQPRRWRQIIVPSAHYAVSGLMSSAYHRTGHIVVRWYLGDHALGIYATAARLVDILKQFVITILNVLTPRMALAARSGTGATRLARFTSVVLALASIPTTIGLIGTAHLVVPWLMGPQYLEDIPLIRWMAAYVVVASASSLLAGTILYAMGRHRAYLASTAGGAIAGVLSYLVLIPMMGSTGAGLAYILGEFAVAAIAATLAPREFRNIWRNPMIGIALGSSLLMLFAVKLVAHYNSHPLVVISAGVLVYACVSGWFVKNWLAGELRVPS